MTIRETISNIWNSAKAESSSTGQKLFAQKDTIVVSSFDYPFRDIPLCAMGLTKPTKKIALTMPDGQPYQVKDGNQPLLLIFAQENEQQFSSQPELVHFDFLDIYAHRQEIEAAVFSPPVTSDIMHRNMSQLNKAMREAIKEIQKYPSLLGHLTL